MTHRILHRMPTEEIDGVPTRGLTLAEVWRGLPNLPFISVPSSGSRQGKRFECLGSHIWVTPDAVDVLADDPMALLSVLGERQAMKYLLKVYPCKGKTPIQAVEAAAKLNRDVIASRRKQLGLPEPPAPAKVKPRRRPRVRPKITLRPPLHTHPTTIPGEHRGKHRAMAKKSR